MAGGANRGTKSGLHWTLTSNAKKSYGPRILLKKLTDVKQRQLSYGRRTWAVSGGGSNKVELSRTTDRMEEELQKDANVIVYGVISTINRCPNFFGISLE